jgi:hypothetical protein
MKFPHGAQEHFTGALAQLENVRAVIDLLLRYLERITVIVVARHL